jgi:ABC-type transport system involved in Fe-S cluster assembly fused permease/ATPase subunit
LLLTGIILAVVFDISYLIVLSVTIALYIWFTFKVTEWRVKIRREMNEQDTDANQKAVDSLLNYETVKYFGAERREADRYDGAMEGYEKAAIKTVADAGLPQFRPVSHHHHGACDRHGHGRAWRAVGGR